MLLAIALCLLCPTGDSQAAPVGAPARLGPPAALAEVRASRLAQPIAVDGVLAEAAWQQGVRVSRFIQRDPIEGAQPSESTVVYVAYDDAALYVAARLYDGHPDSIVARLGRRDAQLDSDRFTVFLDPYHDRRSGFYFGVNAAGTLYDGTLYNDDWDDNSWDGVWEGRARVDSLGWTVELRIPYSQLRFRAAGRYVWGVNFRREITRRNETDYLVVRPKNASGFVSRFADLTGIDRIIPPRRLELLPYVTSKVEYAPLVADDPFRADGRYSPGAGADLKVGIGSNLTLSGSINPDFGQVEVDPAVVNLSDVETFFPEKRPFFIEGSSIFDFGHGGGRNYWGFNWGEPQFFYSRRIGRPPGGTVPKGDNSDSSFADVPGGAHILGAVKLTGKAGSSWNVGILSAATERETARIDTSGIRFDKEVEPLAYYGVFRAQKEFPEGRQGLGFISTVAARSFRDPSLRDDVNSRALTLGSDGWTFLDHEKKWVLTGWVGLTRNSGSPARITDLQENSLHYFQRPDGLHVHVDSLATSLTGWGARLYLNKQKGDWFSNSALGILAPGFDVDDMGFQFRSGVINMHAGAGHDWNKPGRVFRFVELLGAVFRNYDWDGDVTWTGVFHEGSVLFLNYYSINWDVAYNPSTLNDRLTRGGPLALNRPGYQADVSLGSDSRKTWVVGLSAGTYQSAGGTNWYTGPNVLWRPAPSVSLSVQPNYSWNSNPRQYIDTFTDSLATATYGHRYVFGDLRQTQVSAAIRLDWTFTPRLSLQLYAQPLISAVSYRAFKELARPRSFDFNVYGRDVSSISRDSTGRYHVQASGSSSDTLSFKDPASNLRSLRGNAVLRWEFSPGSAIYLVWTQTRSDDEISGDFQFGHAVNRLLSAHADNIFLVKVTYWWNP